MRLATIQRVVRAQPFPGGSAHFTLFGLATAGRDSGDLAFERLHAAEHLSLLTRAVRAAGATPEVRVTLLDPRFSRVSEGLDAVDDPGRKSGRGYYSGLCFKVYARRRRGGRRRLRRLDGPPARQPQGTVTDQRPRP
ncbi:hypothetical protein [Nonomuraea sp. NPDC048916]|uniref:hypothetical protein n=1 Tax=Nonomuraea sp. NPDC048916 TaxID=3154232 RepID=UPI0033EA292B